MRVPSWSLKLFLLSLCFVSSFVTPASAQTSTANEWAWVGGLSSANNPGVYGTLGTAAAANIPGSRKNATSWMDAAGNLWLFGGYGYDGYGSTGYLNDFWRFSASTNHWTWMGGTNLLLAGGPPAGSHGQKGTFDPSNVPGAHQYGVGWTDQDGNLWLFGGLIPIAGSTQRSVSAAGWNDLWEYSVATNQWAWMGGSDTPPQPDETPLGVFGTLGIPSAGSIPGGRYGASSWTDTHGNFWLFGGFGTDSMGNTGWLNDLWEFQPSTGLWRWVSGSSLVNSGGNYGTVGVPSPSNSPGGRSFAAQWIDAGGNFWMSGGDGLDSTGTTNGDLNDVWKYSCSGSLEMSWSGPIEMSGSKDGMDFYERARSKTD